MPPYRVPRVIKIEWKGPFRWPGIDKNSEELPKTSGIYLFTFPFRGGFLIYCAGVTKRSFTKRFAEHSRAYRKGRYNILSVKVLKKGKRRQLWHGLDWIKKAPTKAKREYQRDKVKINISAELQLNAFRVFTAELDPRMSERLEAAIIETLEQSPIDYVSSVPDEGMHKRKRMKSETRLIADHKLEVKLHGLPRVMEF